MTDDDGYFGEEIAAGYDAATSGMHDQSVIAEVVDVLAGLAGDGRARVGDRFWGYDLYDCATQSLSSNYVDDDDGTARPRSIPFRYVWPAELDLMARIAGLGLVERWQDWDGTPFGHESTRHVSVWQKQV